METEIKMNLRRVTCCLRKSMKSHLGKKESLDEKVIHIRAIRIPPSHSQESHNRPKGLRKHTRAMTEPKGKQEAQAKGIPELNPMSRAKQKSRTKVNLRENCIPRTQLTKSYCQYLSNPESKVETKLTTSVKVVSSNRTEAQKKENPKPPKKEEVLHLVLLPQYSVPLRLEISPTQSVKQIHVTIKNKQIHMESWTRKPWKPEKLSLLGKTHICHEPQVRREPNCNEHKKCHIALKHMDFPWGHECCIVYIENCAQTQTP